MKKTILSGLALFSILGGYAQLMDENFDSRSVGEYMGVVSPDWTTWSGAVGGAEDVMVTDLQAASGANSIYFSTASPSGGPQDVLIPFGGTYNTGNFTFEANFYVENNRGAYFNFQGTGVPGGMYSMNCQMVNDGQLIMDAGSAPLIETTFPFDTWFNLQIAINLNTNDWELFIDGVSQGVFTNPNNQVSSADIYPVNAAAGGNNLASYYMDDVAYEHVPYVLPAKNGAVTNISQTSGLATTGISPTVTVRNLGVSAITSFDVDVTYDGTTYTENVTGVSIASLASYNVDFTDVFTLLAGLNVIEATIYNVNGVGADDDASDDTKAIGLNPVVPAPGKVVVGEEATGTWCGWCPRGAVYLEKMSVLYPEHFIGIAVHNGDPMTVENYDTPIGGFISGYPSMLVDRGPDIDPSAVEGDFLERVVIAPKAVLTIGSDYVVGATNMNVSVDANFLEGVSGDYRIAVVVIEDGVTGTASGYRQTNYYSGGGSGVMGGYESLPNPVPAEDMVYDHVARMILPSFDGMEGSFPASVLAGETHTISVSVAIDPTWNLDEVHLVAFLIAPSSQIDNAGFVSIDESVNNGYTGVNEFASITNNINLYPNPTSENANIDLGTVENENVIIEVYDLNGKLVSTRDYGVLNGAFIIPMELSSLERGVYSVRVLKGDKTEVKKLVKE